MWIPEFYSTVLTTRWWDLHFFNRFGTNGTQGDLLIITSNKACIPSKKVKKEIQLT